MTRQCWRRCAYPPVPDAHRVLQGSRTAVGPQRGLNHRGVPFCDQKTTTVTPRDGTAAETEPGGGIPCPTRIFPWSAEELSYNVIGFHVPLLFQYGLFALPRKSWNHCSVCGYCGSNSVRGNTHISPSRRIPVQSTIQRQRRRLVYRRVFCWNV